jgi:hypothetical protein
LKTPLSMREAGNRFAFAVIESASGKVLGSTSYHDIVPALNAWRSAGPGMARA